MIECIRAFFNCIYWGGLIVIFVLFLVCFLCTFIFGQSEQLHRNTDDALKEHNTNNFFFIAAAAAAVYCVFWRKRYMESEKKVHFFPYSQIE